MFEMMVLKNKSNKRKFQILLYEIKIEEKNIEKDELELAINSYYSNLSWHENLALKCGFMNVHPMVEAYENVLIRLNRNERLIDIVEK